MDGVNPVHGWSYLINSNYGEGLTMDENKKFIPSDKVNKIQVGSTKTYKGYTIYVFLCIRLDIRRLNFGGHFQYELEKGFSVSSRPLSHGLNLSDLDNLIYDHIDKLIKEEIKS